MFLCSIKIYLQTPETMKAATEIYSCCRLSPQEIHSPQWRILWRRIHLRTARYDWLFADMNGIVRQIMLQRNTFCVCVHMCGGGAWHDTKQFHKLIFITAMTGFLRHIFGTNRKIIRLTIYHLPLEKILCENCAHCESMATHFHAFFFFHCLINNNNNNRSE